MLNLITKSKIRQEIILLFIYNSNNEYYINELARLIKTSAGNIQRELKRLVKIGFLKKEKRGNAVYFKVNQSNVLLSDFKNIVNKTIGLRHILEKSLQGANDIEFAFLFGSYVKGNFDADSDIDLYIIGTPNEKKLHRKIRETEEKIHREINYHTSTKKEFKQNLKKSFFNKEIVKNFLIIIGDKNEFRKLIK